MLYKNYKELYSELSKEIENCFKPIVFFDDDVDGFASFLQFYHYKKDGYFTPIKDARLTERYIESVNRGHFDKVFVFDKSSISEEFTKRCKLPIVWVDHHSNEQPNEKVRYFNPKKFFADKRENAPPVSSIIYNSLRLITDNPTIKWISIIGCLGDWYVPEYLREYDFGFKIKKDDIEYLLYETDFKRLIRIFLFLQKGKKQIVKQNIKAMMKIKNPSEILNATTENARFILRRVRGVENNYNRMLHDALSKLKTQKDKVIIYVYKSESFEYSLSAELSNELLHLFPNKIILVCRHKDDEYRCSLRSKDIVISKIVEKVVKQIDGYGGGHKTACGACIKEYDFKRFIELFKEEITTISNV